MRQAFGYGSLVNRGTHPFDCAHRTLQGWRRVWVGTAVRPAAFLSVEPAEGEIDGLMIDVPDAAWPDLDRREAHYDRVSLEDGGTIYAVPRRNRSWSDVPILRSYLDVVFQGFEREFGPEGVERFIATTHGWEQGIFDDRASPIYRRAQDISPAETARYDALLASVPEVEKLE